MTEHPTQAVTPGADPEEPGPAPDAAPVDPAQAVDAEFPADDPAHTAPR